MKKNLHPDYQPVVFRDRAAGMSFLTRSTISTAATTAATVEWTDGNSYPVVDVDISAASHPFYTGRASIVDTAGRVEKFRRRYGHT